MRCSSVPAPHRASSRTPHTLPALQIFHHRGERGLVVHYRLRHASSFEREVQRLPQRPPGHPTPGAGASFTPLQMLNGIITPNGLHYERSHGVPILTRTVTRCSFTAWCADRSYSRWTRSSAIQPLTRVISLNARETALQAGRLQLLLVLSGGCTAWSRAPSGPACRCPCCWRKPALDPRRSGCSPKAPTPPG